MKLYSPDNSLLIEIQTIDSHPEGIAVVGKIMGAMPMKAVLRPEELRDGRSLLTWAVIRRLIGMMLRAPRMPKPDKKK